MECRSEIMFDTFILTSHKNGTIKDSLMLSAEHYHGGSQANFSIGPVTPNDSETYTCYGSFNHSLYEWSESSDPIDIKITGLYKKPSLSALMGPVVMSGENMTLTCFSDLQFDMFHLSRKGLPKRHGLRSVKNNNGTFQANFHLGPVVQAGNYRCYGSFRNSSHLWSTPSDPLYLPVTGLYKKPSLSVLMGPMVMSGENMTLSCVSALQFDMFHLSREGPLTLKKGCIKSEKSVIQSTAKKLKIGDLALRDEGAKLNIFSVHPSPGYHEKPSLSGWPSHIVPLGQRVELQCDSPSGYYTFKLCKELGNPIPPIQERPFQKKFIFGPVTTEHAGTYRCYGLNYHYAIKISANSDPVKIIISGIYKKPFLLALQPPLVELGEKVTLECRSEIMFDTFVLTSHKNGTIKDSFKLSAEHYHGGSQANFSIGPVTPDDAGTYTCYGSFNHSPYEWSESGDPIDIKITGLYKKPSLSALMGPVVMSGENMTLSCISNHQFDMFNLSIEGVPLGQGLPAVQSHSGTFKPNFLLGPVIQTGNYRCYGSFSNSSHVWPSSSDPWYFPVTDKKASHRDLIFCD
ncbi:killer cell immunoglobulin-like receptor 3DL1 [Peromyscus maniculatus bairdii]|uniref:killer cell immunoglobulin-like receptor 3DL1 n=1 Tax=Peromyscus maniculatus bairdii TaxID=230844 RepID=UPI003FD4CEC5